MARNKHPEVTEERILDVAQQLFLEKGYENTTIQDIVDGLGGLTKGAVYHHFKSKEEIMDAVGDRMFLENNPFEAVQGRTDLNALEKLREAIRLNQSDRTRTRWTVQAIPLTYSPRVLMGMIEANRRILTPYYQALLEEGTAVLFSGVPCQVDGLYRYLPDSTMCRILAVTGNLKQAAEQMVKTALAVPGGHDNTSVLLARYKG